MSDDADDRLRPADPAPFDDGLFGMDGDDDRWIELTSACQDQAQDGWLGSFRILGVGGRGGQGVVYHAFDIEHGRFVAIKRLRGGPAASQQARERFRREIEIVSSLRHPNIVGVFGVHEVDGQPVLIMEWIGGAPLNEYVAGTRGDPRLEPPCILDLFIAICDAVHYAHQRGVLHRDLKPSNVRIGADGRPRVLDFGMARYAHGERQSMTGSGEFLGTLQYSSPEALRDGADACDARSDLYSIGVMLFEALTGRLPFDPRGSCYDLLARIFDSPRGDLAALAPLLDRAYARVVARALDADPEQRYPTVLALRDDLIRLRHRLPIDQGPRHLLARARRALHRNRLLVAVFTTVIIGLLCLTVTTTISAARMARQRDLARLAEQRAHRAGIRAESAAALEAATVRLIMDVLQARQAELPIDVVRAELAAATAIGDARLWQETRQQAIFMQAAARIQQEMGFLDDAEVRLRHALDIYAAHPVTDDLQAARAGAALASVVQCSGRLEEGAELMLRAERALRDCLPADHPEFGEALCHSAAALIALRRDAEAGPRLAEALAIQTAAFGAMHPAVAFVLEEQVPWCWRRGEPDRAESAAREALAIHRRCFGDRHAHVARASRALADVLAGRGRLAEARALLEAALPIEREFWGEVHPELATTHAALARVALAQDECDAALSHAQIAAAMLHRLDLDLHPIRVLATTVMAGVAEATGHPAAAVALWREVSEVASAIGGPDSPAATDARAQLERLTGAARAATR